MNITNSENIDNFASNKHPKTPEVPISEKPFLTLSEAASYFGIGVNKLRELTNDDNCHYVLYVGTKRLIKRNAFEEYLNKQYSV